MYASLLIFFFLDEVKIKCVICCRPSEDKKDEKVVRDVFGDSDEDEPSPYRAPQNESHHESPVSASHKMTDMTLTDQPFFFKRIISIDEGTYMLVYIRTVNTIQ